MHDEKQGSVVAKGIGSGTKRLGFEFLFTSYSLCSSGALVLMKDTDGFPCTAAGKNT